MNKDFIGQENHPSTSTANNEGVNNEFYNSHKAGLEGLDKQKIAKIIQEASKGSNFYTFQQKRQRRIDQQIACFKEKLQSLTASEKEMAQRRADLCMEDLEANERILNRIIVHFDMDMFYAAVETKDNPELANKPMAVGSLSMISTSNYLARKFGVRSAMAGFIAKRLCPSLVLIKPNFKRYSQESQIVMNLLAEYDPNLKSFSLDEVHIDLTGYVFDRYSQAKNVSMEELGSFSQLPDDVWTFAAECVEAIRARVFETTKLTISAGISCNTLLAKLSTDINKPSGQFMVRGHREEIIDFVAKTEIRKFGGIGPVRSQILQALGITDGKLLLEQRGLVFSLFTESNAVYYLRISLGIGSCFLDGEEGPQKSHSRERTVSEIGDPEAITAMVAELAVRVCKDLQSNKQLCKTITLKLKKASFDVLVKSKTIGSFTDDHELIFTTAKSLLVQELKKSPGERYRLIGLRVSNLNEKDEHVLEGNQLTLPQILKRSPVKHSNQPTETEHKEANQIEELRCSFCGLDFEKLNFFKQHQLFCDEDDEDDGKGCDKQIMTKRTPTKTTPPKMNFHPSSVASTCTVTSNDSILYLTCPICSSNNVFRDNAALNEHIDTCLNRQVCLDLTQISAKESIVREAQHKTPTKIDPKSKKPAKKRKVNYESQQNSLDRYFR